MADIFLERNFEPPLAPSDVTARAAKFVDCFDIHRVDWVVSMLATDGSRMVCWFRAPDAESARLAMRDSGGATGALWPGTVHDRPGLEAGQAHGANVLVERSFDEATALQTIQDIEEAGIHCLEARNVEFVRTLYAQDRQRMICLYEAPDAEAVRQAQREAGVPFADAWSFIRVGPDDMES